MDNLTLEKLSDDATNILDKLTMEQNPRPGVLLVGHSLGGAVVSKMAKMEEYPGPFIGIVLIDTCGDVTLKTLDQAYLKASNRPKSFETLKGAITWASKTNFPRNVNSACISIPSLLYRNETAEGTKFHWKTDLANTSQFWSDWFGDFSSRFLSLLLPKLVLLSDIELLDAQFTKAQIQGKLQVAIIKGNGHLLHEEEPFQVASVIMQFLERLTRKHHILNLATKRKVSNDNEIELS
jgi:protein phosphatase methylesterase 1